jgi:hypothetical protein
MTTRVRPAAASVRPAAASVRPTAASVRPALALLGALAACQGPAHDPCEAYQAYDNVIHDAAEWKALADSGCTVVRGHLTLGAGSADPGSVPAVEEITGGLGISLVDPYREVALPHLRTIAGALIITSSASQEAVHLPALTSVGQFVAVSGNSALKVLDLPNLASSDGGVQVLYNASLEALDLPVLTTLGGLLDVDWNASLARLSLPALSTTGSIGVSNSPALVSVSFPALTEVVDFLYLTDLPILPAVDLPALRAVGTIQYAAGLNMWQLNGATRISMPALRSVSRFAVSGNEVLATLVVPGLDVVGGLEVRFNPAYPECQAIALRDHLVASCGLQWAMIDGNDTTATCGP